MPSRHRVFPTLPLAALLLAVGCAPGPHLRSSERLDDLLLGPDAYPDGFTVEAAPIDALDEMAVSEPVVDGVEPAECAHMFDEGTAALPKGATEGAAQIATSAIPPVLYSYVLASGGPAEDTAAGWAGLVDRCSEMTAVVDGLELRGGLTAEDSPYLPDGGGMVAMDLTRNGMDMSARVAWGRVGDVHFVLRSRDLDAAPAVSTPDLVDTCVEVPTDFDCVEEQREERAAQARARAADEFGVVLFRAVRALEEEG
ncbi:hypothetical protein [Nocardiopsis lucentensis]|uniref:hypothetical protein n=1 Tax=Nocardiopsis lucentensis TaxID=53441 RepID=UPI0003459D1A|nr:hypothetical protein [Nocardiopsis lucentensis]